MADLGSTPLLYSARPALALDGREDKDIREGLVSLAVEETTAGLFCCEATFGNWGAAAGETGFLYFDRQVFDFGRRLSVDMGEGNTAARVFDGRITALEGRYPRQRSPELLVLAEDRFQDLRMVRRTRSFEDVDDSEVIHQVAAPYGLRTELDLDGPRYRVLAQVNQSDLAFLRERARAIDAELWVDGDTLHAQARARRQAEEVTLTYGKSLQEFAVSADLAEQRTRLAVGGWDVAAKQQIDRESAESAIQAELNGGLSGSRVLADSFGQRPERLVHLVPWSDQEAQALADAHYRRQARRFLCGKAVAEGDGRIRVGGRVRLRGLGALFDGRYYVSRVKHSFDLLSGYRTGFCVERAGLGGGT